MLTIFSWPDTLENGPEGMIYRSAIESWMKLEIKPRIVLLGPGRGVAEFCREKKLEHAGADETEKPLISTVFLQGTQARKENDFFACVEPNLLLNDDFSKIFRYLEKTVSGPFLASGRETSLEITEQLESRKDFREAQDLAAAGVRSSPEQIGYFLFSATRMPVFPAFKWGGHPWQQWLIWAAVTARIPVIDLSEEVRVVRLTAAGVAEPPAAREEEILQLAGGAEHFGNLLDADYLFRQGELVKNRSAEYYDRRFLHPLLALKAKMLQPIPFPRK